VPADEPLLSSGQVARKLGVAPRTVSHWVQQGWVRPAVVTAGGRYRYRLSEVEEQLRKRAADRRAEQDGQLS
jgi:DNA-binding transcriptional MerR regulator